ncbi:MAG: hypothetical protein LJF04_11045 [Gemmatimonadetes bacterium]|nr:hypothetical protein [Gemmatimonadota bacterium]
MRPFRRVGSRRTSLMILLVALPVAVAGCTTSVQQPPAAGVVAQLSVDRFLAAANERDLVTMGRIFGTVDGPISDTGSTFGCFFKKIGSWFGGNACRKQQDVQVQMAAIANVLKHDDYKIVREEPVAGRLNEATRVYVNLTTPERQVTDVPFVVVRSKHGQWLVEEVDLKKVMGGG